MGYLTRDRKTHQCQQWSTRVTIMKLRNKKEKANKKRKKQRQQEEVVMKKICEKSARKRVRVKRLENLGVGRKYFAFAVKRPSWGQFRSLTRVRRGEYSYLLNGATMGWIIGADIVTLRVKGTGFAIQASNVRPIKIYSLKCPKVCLPT